MAAHAEDPFARIRDAAKKLPAVDARDADQLQDLKEDIKGMYATWAKSNDLDGLSTDEAISMLHPVWLKTLESALANSSHFQRLVLDEEVTPGSHNFKLLSINEDWFLGVYLPGFYDVFADFGDGRDYCVTSMFGKAITNAKNRLIEIIRKHASRVLSAIP